MLPGIGKGRAGIVSRESLVVCLGQTRISVGARYFHETPTSQKAQELHIVGNRTLHSTSDKHVGCHLPSTSLTCRVCYPTSGFARVGPYGTANYSTDGTSCILPPCRSLESCCMLRRPIERANIRRYRFLSDVHMAI